jgi:hypothetical protein
VTNLSFLKTDCVMTSFAYAPPVMSSAHFESYSTDSYPEFLQTSQPYPTTTGFTEPSFSAALSTFDSMPVLSAYSDVSNAQESSYFTLNRSESVNAYSPVQSPGEHLAPPRLSSSSESGASVQSTSSSTMASPHIQPQYHVDTWNPLVSASGLPIESNDLAPPHDIYFSPPTVDSGSKMSGYVGESISSSFNSVSNIRFPTSNVAVRSVSSSPATSTGSPGSPSSPLFAAPRPQQPIASHGPPLRSYDDQIFKSPGLPASARLPPSYSLNRSQPFDNRPRRNSLLSNQIYPESESPSHPTLPSISLQFPQSHYVSSNDSNSATYRSCWFPSPLFVVLFFHNHFSFPSLS